MPREIELQVRGGGPCAICGREQLTRIVGIVSASAGFSVEVKAYRDCGCGLVEIEVPTGPPPA